MLQTIVGGLDIATDVNMASYARVRAVQSAGLVKIYSPKTSGQHAWVQSYDPDRHQRSAATRAIRGMREIARSQAFDHFVTLTFATNVSPNEASAEWDRMMRKRRHQVQTQYLRVAEWSPQETNLHFHVLCDVGFVDLVKSEWTAGFYRADQIDYSSLDKVCSYMGKSFASPHRPYKRRFFASKGSKPIAHEFFTEDIDRALEIARTVADTHSRYINETISNSSFGTYAEVSWDPRRFWQ